MFHKWVLSVFFMPSNRSETTTPHALGSGLGVHSSPAVHVEVVEKTVKRWVVTLAILWLVGKFASRNLDHFCSNVWNTCDSSKMKKHLAIVCLWGVFAQKVTGGIMYKEFQAVCEKHFMEPHSRNSQMQLCRKLRFFFRMVGSKSSPFIGHRCRSL